MDTLQLYLSLVLSLLVTVFADKEQPIKVSDTGEGTDCDAKTDVALTCIACSGLNQVIAVPITVCCTEPKAYAVCKICTKDEEGCLKDAQKISSQEYIDDSSIDDSSIDDETDIDKRYGRMFMGGWTYPGRLTKRYGRMFVGGYGGNSYLYGKRADKRFGKVFANGGFGYPSRSLYNNIGKRFGRLFTSGGGRKRYGSLFLGNGGW